jgi:hypothetical protein
MKAYGGVDVYIHIFLTLALVCEWLLHTPATLPLQKERAPSTYWIGGWMGPRTDLDNMEKNLTPTRTQTPAPLLSNP